MVKTKLPGVSTIEIMIVLAISSVIFVIASSTFAVRERVSRDDAARLVVANIAKVRNEAQQGVGPTTENGKTLLVGGNQLFGQAIEFVGSEMIVYKLMKTPGGIIKPYEQYSVPLTQQLQWWLTRDDGADCGLFNSCYKQNDTEGYQTIAGDPILLGDDSNYRLIIVFRNNSGQSYVFSRNSSVNDITSDDFMGPWADTLDNYEYYRQRNLRLAYAVPGNGATEQDRFLNAPVQYYVLFDLSIPNDQKFEVVK